MAVVDQGDAAELVLATVIPPSTCAALQVPRTHGGACWARLGGRAHGRGSGPGDSRGTCMGGLWGTVPRGRHGVSQ